MMTFGLSDLPLMELPMKPVELLAASRVRLDLWTDSFLWTDVSLVHPARESAVLVHKVD